MKNDLNTRSYKAIARSIARLLLARWYALCIFLNLLGLVYWFACGEIPPGSFRLLLGVLPILLALLVLIGLLRNWPRPPMQSLEKYAEATDSPEATLARLIRTWESGKTIGPVRMDDAYILAFPNALHPFIIPLDEVVWAYKAVTRYRRTVQIDTRLIIHYANGKSRDASMPENVINRILEALMERQPHIAIGNDSEIRKLYSQEKDFAAIREYALAQRRARTQ